MVRALCSQVRSFLPPKQKRDTPRNFEMKRLFRTPFPNALSVRKRSVTKGVCTGHLAHVPRYVPSYLQNSKGIPLGTSDMKRLIRNAFSEHPKNRPWWMARLKFSTEGKSAINLSNLGKFGHIWPRAIYLC